MSRFLIVCASVLALSGTALAQSAAPEIRVKGAYLLVDRGTGQGRIEVRCSETESTRNCIESALPVISMGGQGGQGPVGVVYATTSLQCGGSVYTVSTGTNHGTCGPTAGSGGKGVTCGEGGNTVASASCDSGCGTQTGGGTCTIVAK